MVKTKSQCNEIGLESKFRDTDGRTMYLMCFRSLLDVYLDIFTGYLNKLLSLINE